MMSANTTELNARLDELAEENRILKKENRRLKAALKRRSRELYISRQSIREFLESRSTTGGRP